MPPLDAAQANDWVTVPSPASSPSAMAGRQANDWVTVPKPDSPQLPEWTTEGGAAIGDSGLEHVLSAAGRGMVAGYGSDNPVMTPRLQAQLDAGGPLDRFVTQPILTAGGAALRAGGAVMGGLQAGVAQAGEEMGRGPAFAAPPTGTGIDARIGQYLRESAASLLDPRLAARDIAATPEAFPTGDTTGGTVLPAPHGVEVPSSYTPVTARQVQARDGVGIMEAWNRAHAENTAGAAKAIADIGSATDIDGAIAAAGRAAEAPTGDATPLAGSAGWTTGDTGAPPRAPFVPQGIFAPSSAPPVGGWGDLFAPRPSNADEGGRAIAQGRQAEASAVDAALPELPVSGANPYLTIPPEPKRLIQFLREPTTSGSGIHATTEPGGLRDVDGEVSAVIGGPTGRPGLIHNIAGQHLDAATQKAWVAGYMPEFDTRPEIGDLIEAIRADHEGTPRYSIEDQDAADAYNHAIEHNSEIDTLASQTGINTRGITRDQFFDALADHLSSQDHAAVQAAAEGAHQEAFDKAVASGKGDGADYGMTSPRTLAELDDEYRQEDTARPTLQGPPNDAGSGPVAANTGAGEAGGGSGGRVAGDAGRDGAQAGVAGQPAARPAPQSVGAAAASRDTTNLTLFGRSAREVKGQQADLELADLMRTPQAGDTRDIVPGATQTRSEIEQKPSVSLEAKGLRQEFRDGFDPHEKEMNDIYHKHLDAVIPSAEMRGSMEDVRQANWQARERTAFGTDPNGQPVSTEPVVSHIQQVLADPINKANSYLKKEFKPFLDAMTDANGDPVWMGAKELYGWRQEMARKVQDMDVDIKLAHVRGEFGDMIKATDSTIGSVAPEYLTMMDEYRAASQPINAAKRLETMPLKVTNGSDRVITFGKLDSYMKTLWLERHGPNPYAPAKDIPQATWDHLMLLHERLARSASSKELAKAQGSDTTQMAMELARKGMIGALHVAVAAGTHGLGNIILPGIIKNYERAQGLKRVAAELKPDLSRYPTPLP